MYDVPGERKKVEFMIPPSLKEAISIFLSEKTGIDIRKILFSPIGGGSINQTFTITSDNKEKYFCKINSATRFPLMFEKEKRGLELLGSKQVIRVPGVIGTFIDNDHQVLLLEYVEQGIKTDSFWVKFGEQLASLHGIQSFQAGLDEDNYMGALPQSNSPSSSWIDFFIQHRLEAQLELAVNSKLLDSRHQKLFEKLYKVLPDVFPDNRLCLLHGDLWSGNFLCDHASMPVLIDPAMYYGHSSMDMGMTTLFGGFANSFYDSYNYQLPFSANYREQWKICNLYPLLIHLNLFGKGYLQSIIATIQHY